MQLKVCGFIVAEGEESELSIYSAMLIDTMVRITEEREKDKIRKELDLKELFGNMTFDQLRKMENEEDGE